eukprot:SAG31_NODE_13_length_37961_cov_21.751307_6_plen_49_part_00
MGRVEAGMQPRSMLGYATFQQCRLGVMRKLNGLVSSIHFIFSCEWLNL